MDRDAGLATIARIASSRDAWRVRQAAGRQSSSQSGTGSTNLV